MYNINDLEYRKGVIAFVINKNKEILVIQKTQYGDNQWDFLGGGVDEGETFEEALYRELKEESGINKDKFRMIGKSSTPYMYDYSPKVIEEQLQLGRKLRGQIKEQYVLEFLGEANDMHFQKEEIRNSKWIVLSELEKHMVFAGQYENVSRVLREFKIIS